MAGNERAVLGFPEAARAAFSFLRSLGFRETSSEDTIVRYESERVFLNVYHGRRSYELGIEIGLRGMEGGYSLWPLIRLSDWEAAERCRLRTAVTSEQVNAGTSELAELVRKYGERALRGDPSFYSDLERETRKWAFDYAAEIEYHRVRPQAEEAFRQREYGRAARLYDSVRSKLSPAELKKLEYAEKHR